MRASVLLNGSVLLRTRTTSESCCVNAMVSECACAELVISAISVGADASNLIVGQCVAYSVTASIALEGAAVAFG
jgi:hypothetical protein